MIGHRQVIVKVKTRPFRAKSALSAGPSGDDALEAFEQKRSLATGRNISD
jgi:hypothetical protein